MAKKSITVPVAPSCDKSVLMDHYDQTTLALSKAIAIANLINNFDSRSDSNRHIKECAGLIEDYLTEVKMHVSDLYSMVRGEK